MSHRSFRLGRISSRCPLPRIAALAMAFCLPPGLAERIAQGEQCALIVAGGHDKWHNPVSLERQTLRAIDALAQRKFTQVDVYFADGDNPEPDLLDESSPRPAADGRPTAESNLRNHRVSPVAGAATMANLERWFRERGARLKRGDELLIYFATHGALAAGEPTPAQSELLLWGGDRLRGEQLERLIQSLPAGVQATLLVTACYGGGFAELGWPPSLAKQANLRPTRSPVAGFFATSFDRPASGCVATADAPDTRDYATCFWSALLGVWPEGRAIEAELDANGDGVVSFDEAHAFALVTDSTLDTPLTTADFALRRISRFGRAEETRLLGRDASYAELLEAAPPATQELLNRLCARWNLTERRRLAQARTELRGLDFELRSLAEERHRLALNRQGVIPAEQQRLEEIDRERLRLEQRWAGFQRFVQVAESVILAHNLPLVVEDGAILERFEALKRVERSL